MYGKSTVSIAYLANKAPIRRKKEVGVRNARNSMRTCL